MESKNNISAEIEKMAPKLSAIPKDADFATPDQYFDNLAIKIQQKTYNKSAVSSAFFRSKFFQYPQYAVAASFTVMLIAAASYFYTNKSNNTLSSNTIFWDEILNSELIIEKIDEALLVETYIKESNGIPDNEKKPKIHSNASSEDISEYVESEYNNDIFNEL